MGILNDAMDYLSETCNGLLVESDYISGISTNTWYYNGSKNIAKTGYEPIAIVGYQINIGVLHLTKLRLNGTTLEYGMAYGQASGTITNVRFDYQILYRKVLS